MSIITIGEILVEMVANEKGQRFDESGIFQGPFPSGAPAIFIDQVAMCGSEAKIISSVGKDGFGRLNLNRLHEDNVDISLIKELKDKSTGVAFVTYDNTGDRDFIFHIADSAAGEIKVDDSMRETFVNCSYFHVMGSSVYNENIKESIEEVFRLVPIDTKISFDPNIRKEILTDTKKLEFLQSVLKKSDIVLASEEELSYLLGNESLDNMLELLFHDYEIAIVVIKKGKDGSTVYYDNKAIEIEAYEVEELDPTGAGDCYAGTFISLLNQGYKPEKAAQYASAAGALAVSKVGPMEGNTTLSELKQFIESRK